jgi:L-ascorbate metabolism protein UlaG (beta-lactamase superfamily)
MATELTWLGHNCWSIATGGMHLLLDPFLDDNPVAKVRSDDVAADYILLSHGHFDHVADAEKIARRTGATIVSNFEICEWFGKRGIEKTHAMNTGGGFRFPFGRVKLTIAHHTSMLPDGAYGGTAAGFLLSLPEGNVYFACDTGLFYDMKLIGAAGLAVAALPVGDNFTMGPDDALEAVKLLGAQRVVPIHRGTWPLIEQDAAAWARRVKAETQSEPVVLEPGGTMSL